MDFSFSDIITYWDILKEYVNPVSIILWALAGGAIGTILMIIILIIFRKKVLIQRRHWTLKVLAYSYMVTLPLWAGFSFTQWFALHGCEREIVKNIPKYLGDSNSLYNEYVKEYVTGIISERHLQLTGHEIIDKSVGYAGDLMGSVIRVMPTEESEISDKIASYLLSNVAESTFFKNILIDKIEESIGKPLLMDKKLTRELLNVKINDLMEDGIINTILTKHVNKLFGGFKMNVLFVFLLILVLPVAEIVLAHYLEKRRLPPPPPVEAIDAVEVS